MPPAFAVDSQAEILAVLRRIAFGHLVTQGVEGPSGTALTATPLPFIVDDSLTTARAHFARANPVWQNIDRTPALFIVPSADAYISPRWYQSKSDHGKVVPTWNYEVIHIHGTIEIHDETEWKRRVVSDLTDRNEAKVIDPHIADPWRVSDAPSAFIDGQLKAIVGVQLNITAVEAKRKLSQNKSNADRIGATQGLARSDKTRDRETATLMRSLDSAPSEHEPDLGWDA